MYFVKGDNHKVIIQLQKCGYTKVSLSYPKWLMKMRSRYFRRYCLPYMTLYTVLDQFERKYFQSLVY